MGGSESGERDRERDYKSVSGKEQTFNNAGINEIYARCITKQRENVGKTKERPDKNTHNWKMSSGKQCKC